MARKSRRQGTLQNENVQVQAEWRTAIYARLSIEDSGVKNSDSIDMQISLVRNYIEQRPYLTLVDTYVDNGLSGTNFERPDFKRLMDDIRCGDVNCVVVKDLSRFGRSYIETCEYLDKIFPFMQVRFISINDAYDSEMDTNYTDGLVISLKNLINDAYAKDISRKVKSANKTRRERGEYTGAFAPYGYKKLETNKSKLVPDEETAPIVRDIFKWRAEGAGKAAIVSRLESMNIPCPSMRLRNKGKVKGEGYYKSTVWQPKAIDQIICNMVYIGHLAQGKTSQALYEHKHLEFLPKSEWCIVENTHEPIVSAELWEAANRVRTERRKEYFERQKMKDTPENIFKGLLVCGTCGSKLVRVRSIKKQFEYYYYRCELMRQHKEEDKYPESIPAKHIYDVVFASIKAQIELAGDVLSKIQKRGQKDNIHTEIDKKIMQVDCELKKNTNKRDTLYENYVDRLLTENEYIIFKKEYEQRDRLLKQKLDELYQQKNIVKDSLSSNDKWIAAANELSSLKELSRNMLLALVDRIVVSNHNIIKIVFKYKDEIEFLNAYINANISNQTKEGV